MIEHKYPYTDAHELNLDWILEQIKGVGEIAASIEEWKSTIEAGIAARELLANKKQSVTNSNTDYPSTKAVRDYVTDFLQSYELIANKLTAISGSGDDVNYPTTKAVVDYVNSNINAKLTTTQHPDLITVNKTIIGAINEAASLIANPNIVFVEYNSITYSELIEYINQFREVVVFEKIMVASTLVGYNYYRAVTRHDYDDHTSIPDIYFQGLLDYEIDSDHYKQTIVIVSKYLGWSKSTANVPRYENYAANMIRYKTITTTLSNIPADGSGNPSIALSLPSNAVVKNVSFYATDDLNRFVVWAMSFTNTTAKFGYINHRTSATNATIKAVVEYVLT